MTDETETGNETEITPAELHDLLETETETDDAVRIVDIRSPVQFERGAIPGSENIPFQELPTRVESLADAERVVTVCPHGKASLQAVRLIESYEGLNGADVRSLQGGLEAWGRDYALEANSDEKGSGSATGSTADAPF